MEQAYRAEVNVESRTQDCIDLCLKAHALCLQTAMYRIAQKGEMADLVQVRLLFDCAQLCQTHADLMSRHSEYVPRLSPLCATACTQVATACEMHPGDPQLAECGRACRAAGDSCQQMTYAGSALGAVI